MRLPQILAAASLLTLAACASTGADLTPPVAATQPEATFQGAPAQAAAQNAAQPRTDWWAALHDPVLNRLVERALGVNRDLLAAEAEVKRARALAKVESWRLLPFGGVTVGAGRQRIPAQDLEDNYVAASGDISWEADVFGRLRAGARAADAEAIALDDARRGVMTTIATQTALTYADLRGAQARLAAATANAEIQQETVRLTEALREGGRATPLDIMRARAQLETTQAAAPLLQAQIEADIAALDVLVAGLPEDLKAELRKPGQPPAAPSTFALGSPDDLLRRRPDIRQAEAQVRAAAARVDATRVDWWPRISFLGTVSSVATGIGGIGERSGLSFNVGPQIDWPLLDFRRNALRTEAARAGFEAEFLRYDKAVLGGIRDVESALAALDGSQRSEARFTAAVDAARRAAEVSRLRYREGADAFFNVLDSERILAQAEDSLAAARTRTTMNYIRLGQALGAGWSDRPEPPQQRLAAR